MEMRTWATKLVVEPSPSSPIREWLEDKLEQCGFDGNLTSRCVFSIIDRRQCNSPGLRIELCPSSESMFDCAVDGRHLSSMSVHNRSSLSGRRLGNVLDCHVDYGQVTEVMEVLRLMASPEDWELHTETIQRVVTELFSKLKEQHVKRTVDESDSNQPSATQSPTSDFESSSSQDQAARYYEAFPSLSIQCDMIASANSSFNTEWSRVAQMQPRVYDSPKSDDECHLKATSASVKYNRKIIYSDSRLPSCQKVASTGLTRHARSRRDRNRQSRYSAERSRRKNRISYIDQSRWPTSYISTQYFTHADDASVVMLGSVRPYWQTSNYLDETGVCDQEGQNDLQSTSYKDRFSNLECHCWNKPSHEIDSRLSESDDSSKKYKPLHAVTTQIARASDNFNLHTTNPALISSSDASVLTCPLLPACDEEEPLCTMHNSSHSPNDEFLGCRPHDPDLWPILKSQRICMTRHRSVDRVGTLGNLLSVTPPLCVDRVQFTSCMPANNSVGYVCPAPGELDQEDVPSRSMASIINEADKIHCALAKFTSSSAGQSLTQIETSAEHDRWSGVKIALAICDQKSVFQPQNCETINQIWQPLGNSEGEVVTAKSDSDYSHVQGLWTSEIPDVISTVSKVASVNVPSVEDSIEITKWTRQKHNQSDVNLTSDFSSTGIPRQPFSRERLESDKSSVKVDETGVSWTLGNERLGNCEVTCSTWDSCIYAYPVSELLESPAVKNEPGMLSVSTDQFDNLWRSGTPTSDDCIESNMSYDCSKRIVWSSTPKDEIFNLSAIQSELFNAASGYGAFVAGQSNQLATSDTFKPTESIESVPCFPVADYCDGAVMGRDWLDFSDSCNSAQCQKVETVQENDNLKSECFGEMQVLESSSNESAVELSESCDVVGIVSDVIAGNADVYCDSVCETAPLPSKVSFVQLPVASECALDYATRSIWINRVSPGCELFAQEKGLIDIGSKVLSMNSPLAVDCLSNIAGEQLPAPDSIISDEDAGEDCCPVDGKSQSSSSVSDIIFSDSDSSSNFAVLTDVTSENSSVFYSSDSAEVLELPNSCLIDGVSNDDQSSDCHANADERDIWQLNQPSFLQLNQIWCNDLNSSCDVESENKDIGAEEYLNVNCSSYSHLECVSPMLPSIGSVLVPSENTAFCDDIPQRMPRVVSEPVLSPYVPLSRLPRTLVIRHSSNSVYPQWQWSSANCVLTMKLSPSRQFRPISTPLSTDSEPDSGIANSTAAVPTKDVDSSLSLGFLGESELESGVVYQRFVARGLNDKLSSRCPDDCSGAFLPRFKVRCELEKAAQTSSDIPPQKKIVQEILLGVSSEFHDDSSPCDSQCHLTESAITNSQLSVDVNLDESKLVPRRLSQIWSRCDDSSEKGLNNSVSTAFCYSGSDASLCDSTTALEHCDSLDQMSEEFVGSATLGRFAMFSDASKAIWCPVAEDAMTSSVNAADKSDSVSYSETTCEKSELVELTNKFESLGLCGKIWSNNESDETADLTTLLPCTDNAIGVPACEAALKAIWSKPDDCVSEECHSNQPFTNMVAGIEGLLTLGMLMGPVERRNSCIADYRQWPSASFERDLMGFPPSDGIENCSYQDRRTSQSAEAMQACLSGAYSIASGIRPLSMLSAYTDARSNFEGPSGSSVRSSSEHSYFWYPVISAGNDVSLDSVLGSTTSQSTLFSSLPVSVATSSGSGEMNHEQVLHLLKQLSPGMSSTSKHIGGSLCQLASTNSRPVDLWT